MVFQWPKQSHGHTYLPTKCGRGVVWQEDWKQLVNSTNAWHLHTTVSSTVTSFQGLIVIHFCVIRDTDHELIKEMLFGLKLN